jgi:hypothetical protein
MPSVTFPTFNPSKFTLVLCLEAFSVVLALRLDGFIAANYWLVFTPLWFLGAVTLAGGTVGIISWLRKDRRTRTDAERKEFFQMVSITVYYVGLISFAVMICANLESPTGSPYLNWGAIFLPLLLVSFVSCFLYFFWKLFSRPAMVCVFFLLFTLITFNTT